MCGDSSYASQPDFDIGISGPYDYSVCTHAAVPISAARISLPSQAGTASLLDLLPPDIAARYAQPTSLLRAKPLPCRVRPSALCASRADYIALIQRLHQLGMVVFKSSVKVVNGVFAVIKDDDSDRLIIDARPSNSVFDDPPPASLSTPDLLAQLHVPADRVLYVAKTDIDNCYHRFRLPVWMQDYFGLPPVSSSELGLVEQGILYPCCVTLPMGFSHAVFLAQTAHEHVLNTRTSLRHADRISPGSDLFLDRTRHSVYIDDVILIGTDRDEVERLQQEYISVVVDAGIPAKQSKVIAPSSGGVECLGLVVDGVEHTVGVSVPKLQRLISDTRHILNRGTCTGLDLAAVVGRWSWAILACRPVFAVFNSVYRFIQMAGRRVFTIWKSVHRELDVIIGCAPLLFSRLDSIWFDRVVATDASSTGMGVVFSRSSQSAMSSAVAVGGGYRARGFVPTSTLLRNGNASPQNKREAQIRKETLTPTTTHTSSSQLSLDYLGDAAAVSSMLFHGNASPQNKREAQIRKEILTSITTHTNPVQHVDNVAPFVDSSLLCNGNASLQNKREARIRKETLTSTTPHTSYLQHWDGGALCSRGDRSTYSSVLCNGNASPQNKREAQIREDLQLPILALHSSKSFLQDHSSWSTIVSSPWSASEHINVLELRSITTALRWVLSHPTSICRRLLLLSDSCVAVHSISKGRSSSFQILRRLRYLSALVLASGLQLFCRWVPSHDNPADRPSRFHSL